MQPSNEAIKLTYDGQSVDWFLQRLVSIVNTSDLEFGITLTVGGSIVSGTLVGGTKYFETFAKDFSGAWPKEAQEVIREALASHTAIYKAGNDDQEPTPPQFLHLINARSFQPTGQLPNNRGVLWRGKINSVSGFSLGSLAAENG